MVNPNPTPTGSGAGGGPPSTYDPYQALIAALRLPDETVDLIKPAFDQLGAPLELDPASVIDFGKAPLPHYRAVTPSGRIVLLHVADDVAANPYGQPSLSMIVLWFLKQAKAIYIFSEVDSFAFDTDTLVALWQQTQPNLKVRFITLPLIQQLESELDPAVRSQNVRALFGLDDLLLASQLPLEAAIEKAYHQARYDLLDSLSGLPEKLTELDRRELVDFLALLAISTPAADSKKYFLNLVSQLGLETRLTVYIISSFSGNALNDAEALFLWVEERTYPNGGQNGYQRVLGYLLNLLADQGGGKKIALIIFKYRLVGEVSVLQTLVSKYP